MLKKTYSFHAPAKINLFLRVHGRLAGGYHDLSSLVAFADIGDRLEMREDAFFQLDIQGPYSGAFTAAERGENNLVWRAAHELAKKFAIEPKIHILLKKNLPLASGIGGGSADAAACIKALSALWQLPENDVRISSVLASLGADVPVCHYGRPALIKSKGDVLHPASVPLDVPIVLINPHTPCATRIVFEHLKSFSGSLLPLPGLQTLADLALLMKQAGNDLLAPALEIAPEIAEILDCLHRQKGCMAAQMSGSGATCFGIFENKEKALTAASALQRSWPEWWVKSGLLNPRKY